MMLQNPLHTAAEMREISDLAHVAEGLTLGAAAIIALLQARGKYNDGRYRYAWPALVVVAGAFLLSALVVPHHGLALARTQWAYVFGDAQQRQHFVISLLMLVGGGAELFAMSRELRGRMVRAAWPAVLTIVGLLFLVHAQHGTGEAVARATLLHRAIGSMLILAGAAAGIDVFRPRPRRPATIWPLALLAAAVLLIVYREPEGAYLTPMDHGTSHTGSQRQPGK